MKKLLFISILLLLVVKAKSQIVTPVKWSYAAKRISEKEAVIMVKATIDSGWHIYSTVQPKGGPRKTNFKFASSKDFDLNGIIQEPVPMKRFSPVFEINVLSFEKSVIFQQRIALKNKSTIIKGSVEFMVCDSKRCLPPETISFEIPIN